MHDHSCDEDGGAHPVTPLLRGGAWTNTAFSVACCLLPVTLVEGNECTTTRVSRRTYNAVQSLSKTATAFKFIHVRIYCATLVALEDSEELLCGG